MKALLTVCAAALFAAGCATTDNVQMARADCKVAPAQTATVANQYKSKPVDSLRQREAEMQLASTQYRMQQLHRNGVFNNNIEEALRDCN